MRAARAGMLLLTLLFLSACGDNDGRHVLGYVDIDLIRLAPSQSGRLEQLLVKTGDTVQAGQRLFQLDATPEAASVAAAQARIAATQATARDLDSGRRPPEIEAIQAQIAQAEASLELARDQLRRSQAVYDKGFVSADQLDAQTAAVKQGEAQVAQLRASLDTARLAGREEARKSAQAAVAQASAEQRAEQWKLDETAVSSPDAGSIEQVYYRPGEWVNAGQPVLDLYVNSRIKLRFFVPETRVGTLRVGDVVQAGCDGCTAFQAHIRFISREAEFTPPEIYSQGQREKLVYLVEATPDHPERLHAGQPVDVTLPEPGAAP